MAEKTAFSAKEKEQIANMACALVGQQTNGAASMLRGGAGSEARAMLAAARMMRRSKDFFEMVDSHPEWRDGPIEDRGNGEVASHCVNTLAGMAGERYGELESSIKERKAEELKKQIAENTGTGAAATAPGQPGQQPAA